jgi:CRP-like cAMP-binding protein
MPLHQPTNRLLEALQPAVAQALLAAAVPVELPLGTRLFAANETPAYLYLLTSGLGSVVFNARDGSSVEISTQGREGLIGASFLLGPLSKSSDCHMQVAGAGFRIPLGVMQKAFHEDPQIRRRVLEFEQHQYIAVCQVAACNRLHRAEARFVRWLLMVADRVGNEIAMTHEFMATMLGARRTTVTEVCADLARLGAIEGRRGGMHIQDRKVLEQHVCECYANLRCRFDALYAEPQDVPSPAEKNGAAAVRAAAL